METLQISGGQIGSMRRARDEYFATEPLKPGQVVVMSNPSEEVAEVFNGDEWVVIPKAKQVEPVLLDEANTRLIVAYHGLNWNELALLIDRIDNTLDEFRDSLDPDLEDV